MDTIYGCCCGVDVHKNKLAVCVRTGRKKEFREFGTTTTQLLELSEWLRSCGCEMVAMESTGSYWKGLFNVLEAAGIPAMVVNAAHIKNVPGRKTDAKDAEWIAELLQYGLLKASFIPDKPHRELREKVVYRRSIMQMRSAESNRLQKILEGANIKLGSVLRDILGMTGTNLLKELISNGVPSPDRVRSMREEGLIYPRLKATPEELIASMQGSLTEAQRGSLALLLEHIGYLDKMVVSIDKQIDEMLSSRELAAVDLLATIPSVAEKSAKAIISFIGDDMRIFSNADALCAWAGLAPGNNESAGKRKGSRTRKGNETLKSTLVVCAQAAVHQKDTFLSARYRRLCARMPRKKAIVAIAHSILRAIWHMLTTGEMYQDLGPDYYRSRDKEQKIAGHLKKLRELGWTPESASGASI